MTAAIGILMLDTRFPRPPGDVGNPASFDFPVIYRVVDGATPERAVARRAEGLLPAFEDAARALAAEGVAGLATTCGFLAPFQRRLAAASGLPVLASPLWLLPMIGTTLAPGRVPGVLTISGFAFGADLLIEVGADPATPVAGLPAEGALAGAILGNLSTLDATAAEREMIEAAQCFKATHSGLGAIVLECANMAPYASEVRRATGLPIYSMVGALRWFQASLAPPCW